MATKRKEEKVIYEKEGVYMHTTSGDGKDELINGALCMTEKETGPVVEWKPVHEAVYDVCKNTDPDWAVIDTVGYKKNTRSLSGSESSVVTVNPGLKHKYIVNFELRDLKSFKRSCPASGWSFVIFILKDGTTYPALHFHHGGSKSFINALRVYLHIRKSTSDNKLFLVKDEDPGALSRSFDELQLFKETSTDLVHQFIKDPYTSTMGGFSKVTNFLKDVLLVPEQAPKQRPPEEIAEILHEEIPSVDVSQQEPGFEVVTQKKLPARRDIKRSMKQPIEQADWKDYMDKDGRINNVQQLKEDIFRRGIHPSIRAEVWKFLLGYYKWNSTFTTRTDERKQKVDDYFRMKLQWKSVSQDQERRFSLLKERKSLIDKDVTRTDRTHHFFQGENNPNLHLLNDILITYCMYDFDLGYVQGMSDLLAPIIVVMENEVDAFWCFAGFMELVHENFELDQEGMKRQLNELHALIQFIDSKFSNYLESHESGNLYFCFRWLLIYFKREFTFPDIMQLWEVMWTQLPCSNYHLIVCCAILDTEKEMLMENGFGFTEILRHINDMSCCIKLEDTLKKAEAIYYQLIDCKHLPNSIRDIIGLNKQKSEQKKDASSGSSRESSPTETIDTLSLSSNVQSDQHNGYISGQTLVTGSDIITPDDSRTSSIEIIPEVNDDMVFSGY